METTWTVMREEREAKRDALVLMAEDGLGEAWGWLPDGACGGEASGCSCLLGERNVLTLWAACPDCEGNGELVRCAGCGLTRCSANCGFCSVIEPDGWDG